jgi:hypothetical protein
MSDERLRVPLLRASTVTLGRAACVLAVAGAAHVVARQVGSTALDRWVWLAASVVLAAVVIASRSPLDRLADRVAYGASGDPHSRLSGFVERISETLAVDDVLPRVAQTVTQATHSDRSDVRLWLGDGVEVREVWPPASEAPTRAAVDVPLRHHGDQVGVLGVATERHALTADGRAVLDRLAGTAGLALANVRLTYDLRHRLEESRELAGHLSRSRQRLLVADAEQTERFTELIEERVRRRLEAVEGCLDRARHPDGPGNTPLEDAVSTATSALSELRDIAAGVFPPTLSDNGLRVALESTALRYDGRVVVAHHGPERRVSPVVEASAYRCSVELVRECAAAGGHARVDLDLRAERLRVGVRLDRAPSTGTMQLVADRVEAMDGVLDDHPEASANGTGSPPYGVLLDWPLTEPEGAP